MRDLALELGYLVSIHAPTRGATNKHTAAPLGHSVSIHAPTRGATSRTMPPIALKLFQFTRPRGARL